MPAVQLPRHGEKDPVEAWEYRGRPCLVYGAPEPIRKAVESDALGSPQVQGMYETFWCGYTRTSIDPNRAVENLDVQVYGGITFGITENGWIGFDTAHGPDGGPQSVEDVKREVESLVDQLSAIERRVV